MSLNATSVNKFARILYIREFLDFDGYLKDKYGDTPLDKDQSQKLTEDPEKWNAVLKYYLSQLTDQEKEQFIAAFSVELNGITKDTLTAKIISERLLTNKNSTRDLEKVLATLKQKISDPATLNKFVKIVYIREFLDFDGFLKDKYNSSPLEDNQAQKLTENPEKWNAVLKYYLEQLTPEEKEAFIAMFPTELAGITKDTLTAKVIAERLLNRKNSSSDLEAVLCKLGYSENGYQAAFCPNLVSDGTGGGSINTASAFVLKDESSAYILGQSQKAYGEIKPTWIDNKLNWSAQSENYSDFLDLNSSLALGGGYVSSDTDQIGEAGKAFNLNLTSALDWNAFMPNKYKFNLGLYGAYDYSKSGYGEFHSGRGGFHLEMQNLEPKSYLPSGGISLEYTHNQSPVPMIPNRNRKGLRLGFNVSDSFKLPVNFTTGINYDVNFDASGLREDKLSYQLGASYTVIPGLTVYGGYRMVYDSQEIRFNPYNPENVFYVNTGHGAYAGLLFDPGYLSLAASAYYTWMAGFASEAGANIDFSYPLGPGQVVLDVDYKHQNINSGVNDEGLVKAGYEYFIPGISDEDGTGTSIEFAAYAGGQNINQKSISGLPDEKGFSLGGLLTFRFGTSPRHGSVNAPASSTYHESKMRQHQLLNHNNDQSYSDPVADASSGDKRVLYSDEMNALQTFQKANGSFLQWADIRDDYYVEEDEPAYIGFDAQKLNRGQKSYIINIMDKRTTLGIALDAKPSSLCSYTMSALETSYKMQADSASIKFEEIQKYGWTGSEQEFTAQLKAEFEAKVFGKASVVYAKCLLAEIWLKAKQAVAQEAVLTEEEIGAINNLTEFNKEKVGFIIAYAVELATPSTAQDQKLPSAEEMNVAFGLTQAETVDNPEDETVGVEEEDEADETADELTESADGEDEKAITVNTAALPPGTTIEEGEEQYVFDLYVNGAKERASAFWDKASGNFGDILDGEDQIGPATIAYLKGAFAIVWDVISRSLEEGEKTAMIEIIKNTIVFDKAKLDLIKKYQAWVKDNNQPLPTVDEFKNAFAQTVVPE